MGLPRWYRWLPAQGVVPTETWEIERSVPLCEGTWATVRIVVDKDLNVTVEGDRQLASGAWNLSSVYWFDQGELGETALELVEGEAMRFISLFCRRLLDPSWLSARARAEVGA